MSRDIRGRSSPSHAINAGRQNIGRAGVVSANGATVQKHIRTAVPIWCRMISSCPAPLNSTVLPVAGLVFLLAQGENRGRAQTGYPLAHTRKVARFQMQTESKVFCEFVNSSLISAPGSVASRLA